MYKVKVVPPPLPPPYDEPDSDSETDYSDMPALVPPTPPAQRRTALADWAVRLGDMSDDDDMEIEDILYKAWRMVSNCRNTALADPMCLEVD